MSDTTLIQLVSEQAMPNLLAAMAIKPARIVHLCTPSMKGKSACLKEGYRAAGLSAAAAVTEAELSAMPHVDEVRELVALEAAKNTSPVLNFTGGTKMMSIGAYLAAGAFQSPLSRPDDTLPGPFPSFYVNGSDDFCIVDGRTAPGLGALLPGGDFPLRSLMEHLSIEIIAATNGVDGISAGNDWHVFSEFTDCLLKNRNLEANCHAWADKLLQTGAKSQDGKPSRIDFSGKPLKDFPLRNQPLKLALAAGLFHMRNKQFYPGGQTVDQTLAAQADFRDEWASGVFPLSFLQGKWWEVAVMKHLAALGRYRDLRWSVSYRGTTREEDILGIDGVNLLCVSCKRGGGESRIAGAIEELSSRAEHLGGSKTKKILAVCITNRETRYWQYLEDRCRDLCIELITREDLLAEAEP